jgi:L-alanine-DL-glutamate epimerase-like enolase superfamily enzyme
LGAIRFAKVLEPFRPLWFEEPVPPANVDEMAEVARGTSIPICAGERLSTKYDSRQLLNAHAAHILNLDMGRIGGFLETKKVAGLAEVHYAQITPHVYAGPLVAAASMQLAACSPNLLIMECIEQFGGFPKELLSEPLPWRSGYLIPSVRAGFGRGNQRGGRAEAFGVKAPVPIALDRRRKNGTQGSTPGIITTRKLTVESDLRTLA